MDLEDRLATLRFLIHDRDPLFTTAFAEVFRAEGLRIITTMPRTPRMNAHRRGVAGTQRRELLDRVLILNERHLATGCLGQAFRHGRRGTALAWVLDKTDVNSWAWRYQKGIRGTVTSSVGPDMWIMAAIAVAAGVAVAVLLRAALRRLRRQAERTSWRGDDVVLGLLRSVLPWGAVIVGVWVGALRLPLSPGYRSDADHVLVGVVVVVLTLAVARMVAELVRGGALSRSGTSGSATIFVNIARIVVIMIGALVLLDSLGVAIAPLLTALGVGGLAVALALQDTLSNLFAGVHILASRKVVPGDFIQLDNGMEGYVVDTNWRNTTVRQLPNNIVIVPNATLASSVVTNYHQPERETSVSVPVGVSYDSDLEHVERVTCEVGREVMREVEGAVPTHEPFIRYNAFADSSVNFNVILRAAEVTGQHLIRHEFIKRLHRRYQAEAIEIPFPIRTVLPGRGAPIAIETHNGVPWGALDRTLSGDQGG